MVAGLPQDRSLTAGQRYAERLKAGPQGNALSEGLNALSSGLNSLVPARRKVSDAGLREREIMAAVQRGEIGGREGYQEIARLNMESPFMGVGVGNIKAFHGSPHAFTKFSTEHIGKGEGAQAYGHGLYFAENPGVAGDYQRRLARHGVPDAPGQDAFGRQFPTGEAVIDGIHYGSPKLLSDAYLRGHVTRAQVGDDLAKEFDRIANPGRLYEVNLKPEPEDFLDWDKPLSQQSEKVRAAFKAIHGDIVPAHIVDKGEGWRAGSRFIIKRGETTVGSSNTLEQAQKNMAAFEMQPLGGGFYDLESPEIAQSLRKAGIRGIRYKDAGSRSKEGGTYNYVVFDDADVEILGTK